jgi:hypothetical protein
MVDIHCIKLAAWRYDQCASAELGVGAATLQIVIVLCVYNCVFGIHPNALSVYGHLGVHTHLLCVYDIGCVCIRRCVHPGFMSCM